MAYLNPRGVLTDWRTLRNTEKTKTSYKYGQPMSHLLHGLGPEGFPHFLLQLVSTPETRAQDHDRAVPTVELQSWDTKDANF